MNMKTVEPFAQCRRCTSVPQYQVESWLYCAMHVPSYSRAEPVEIRKDTAKMEPRKWKIFKVIGANNEQPGIQWARAGIAALDEPATVLRIEYFDTKTKRDFAVVSGKRPSFAV